MTLTVARGLKLVQLPLPRAVVRPTDLKRCATCSPADGFFINPVLQFSNTVDNGLVITTNPAPGTKQRSE